MRNGIISAAAALMAFSIFLYSAGSAGALETGVMTKLVIENFNDGDSISLLGTDWQAFTDRVMGGQSDMEARINSEKGNNFLEMRGDVSLRNNGGFIQIRLPLSNSGKVLNASEYSGFYISLRGSRGPYFLHLRTPDNRAPWSYYAAEVQVSDNWTTLEVPWSAFEPVSTAKRSPDIGRLTSLGIVAAEKEFQAELDISELGLYRNVYEL